MEGAVKKRNELTNKIRASPKDPRDYGKAICSGTKGAFDDYFKMIKDSKAIIKGLKQDKEKYGYYEKSIWYENIPAGFYTHAGHLIGEDLDKSKRWWAKVDQKLTYYNSMDIWGQFFLKFMFGNRIDDNYFINFLLVEIHIRTKLPK